MVPEVHRKNSCLCTCTLTLLHSGVMMMMVVLTSLELTLLIELSFFDSMTYESFLEIFSISCSFCKLVVCFSADIKLLIYQISQVAEFV